MQPIILTLHMLAYAEARKMDCIHLSPEEYKIAIEMILFNCLALPSIYHLFFRC